MNLRIAPDLEFPIDAVTQKFAWIGRSGGGKSYGLKRFVEQMLHAGVQVIVLDTVGIWHGLRLGQGSFGVPVLGGIYGDIPLEPTSGVLVAEVAVAHGSSLVLDTSQMIDAQRTRFCEAFGRRLFELKKASPSAMHIVLDEGQDIVPQNTNDGEKMMLHEWVRIAKQGRAFGIGLSISSQRPQEVNKKALNQAECVIAFQLTGYHERKAVEYWLSDKGLEAQLSDTLTTLEIGRPFVWSPQWLKISRIIERILPIESADTSQTPKVGEAPRAARAMKPIDLSALQTSMASAVEEHRENDPKALKDEVKRLREQLQRAPVAVFDREAVGNLLELLNDGHQQQSKRIEEMVKSIDVLRTATDSYAAAATRALCAIEKNATPKPLPESVQPKPKETLRQKSERTQAINKERQVAKSASAQDTGGIPIGEFETLKVISSAKDGASINLIVLNTGYRKGSIKSYAARLITRGLARRESSAYFSTPKGFGVAPAKKLPGGNDLVTHYLNTLPPGEASVLGAIKGGHPAALVLNEIVERTEGLAAGSIKSYAARLVTRGLVTRVKGRYALSGEFKL